MRGWFSEIFSPNNCRQVLGLKPDDDDGDDLEARYEESALRQTETAEQQFSVDPVDVLPVKTLVGELRYRSTSTEAPGNGSKGY